MSNTRFYARAALGVAVGVLSIAFLPLSGVLTVRAEGAELLPDVAARGDVAGVRRLLDGGTPADTRQPSTGWTALIAAPVIFLYQGWTYWVLRKRVSRSTIEAAAH